MHKKSYQKDKEQTLSQTNEFDGTTLCKDCDNVIDNYDAAHQTERCEGCYKNALMEADAQDYWEFGITDTTESFDMGGQRHCGLCQNHLEKEDLVCNGCNRNVDCRLCEETSMTYCGNCGRKVNLSKKEQEEEQWKHREYFEWINSDLEAMREHLGYYD